MGEDLPHHVSPHAGEPEQQVLVLGQLHLELTLSGLGPLGKDVQNQPGAVQHLHPQLLAEHPHLGGRQLIVKYRQVAVVHGDELFHLLHLAVADKAEGVGSGAVLHDDGHGIAAGGVHQRGQLLHGDLGGALVLIHAGGGKPGQHRPFSFILRIFYGNQSFFAYILY